MSWSLFLRIFCSIELGNAASSLVEEESGRTQRSFRKSDVSLGCALCSSIERAQRTRQDHQLLFDIQQPNFIFQVFFLIFLKFPDKPPPPHNSLNWRTNPSSLQNSWKLFEKCTQQFFFLNENCSSVTGQSFFLLHFPESSSSVIHLKGKREMNLSSSLKIIIPSLRGDAIKRGKGKIPAGNFQLFTIYFSIQSWWTKAVKTKRDYAKFSWWITQITSVFVFINRSPQGWHTQVSSLAAECDAYLFSFSLLSLNLFIWLHELLINSLHFHSVTESTAVATRKFVFQTLCHAFMAWIMSSVISVDFKNSRSRLLLRVLSGRVKVDTIFQTFLLAIKFTTPENSFLAFSHIAIPSLIIIDKRFTKSPGSKAVDVCLLKCPSKQSCWVLPITHSHASH